KHSEEVVKKMLKAAEIVGEKAKPFGSTFLQKLVGQISGGTDATAFSKAGIKAANISAMEFKKFPKFYHQPSDTLDKIERGALEITLRTCIGYLIISKGEK
ncbi:MAG: M28 family peptidase, partial [Promethearchaeota archaeon]